MKNEKKEKAKSILRELLSEIPIADYPDFFTTLIVELAWEKWE